jgi:hypothetical protein
MDSDLSCESEDWSGRPISDLADGIVFPREQKSSQDHFLAITAPELSKNNTNAKRRANKSQLVIHIDNAICYHDGKTREYFARKTMMRISHSVHSPDLSPGDF